MTDGLRRWRVIEGSEAAILEDELRREMPVGHALHARAFRAVARRDECDDVAFEVEGAGLCVVHLTWRPESDPQWPHAVLVAALTDEEEAE